MRPLAIFRFSPTEEPGRFAIWAKANGLPTQLIALDEAATIPADANEFSGIAMMGGAMSVNDKLPWIAPMCAFIRDAIGERIPVFGHCLGGQLMAMALGAKVTKAATSEIGWMHVDTCDRGARKEWFGGLPRFAAFQWHYDAFELPPMATRVLTNAFNPNQGYLIDDLHIGLQCHVEMTREMIESWCTSSPGELPTRSNAHLQSAADIMSDLPARLAALNAVADGIYDRWAKGLRR